MRVIKVGNENRSSDRRQRLLEARRRHLLFEAKKKKRMKEAGSWEGAAEKTHGAKAKEMKDGKYANVGQMEDAKPNRKVVPALESKRRSLSERRSRINEMRARRMRLEAKARRLHESAQQEARPTQTRQERFLEWLERRERRKLMEARRALREAAKKEKDEEEEPMEECNECGEEEARPAMRSRRARPMRDAAEKPPAASVSEARRLREARLNLIRKSLAEARARREAALRESAEDAVKTLEPPVPKNPVPGEDLQDPKDSIEKGDKLEGPDAPHQEENVPKMKSGSVDSSLVDLKGDPAAVAESKRSTAKGLRESQAYINRKARLQKYLLEHAK